MRSEKCLRDSLEADGTRRLHQHDIVGPHLITQEGDGGIDVRHMDRLLTPGSLTAGPQVHHPRALAHTHQSRDVQAHCEAADGIVLLHARIAQLPHLPEHGPGPTTSGHGGQGLQRCTHGLRVRVVGVVDDREAGGAHPHLHAPTAGWLRRAQGIDHNLHGHAHAQPDGSGGQRIGDIVLAAQQERDGQRVLRGRVRHREGGPSVLIQADVRCPHIRVCGLAEGDDARCRLLRHRRHGRIVEVQHCGGIDREITDEFRLGLRNGLARAEHPEMGRAHIQHDSDIGLHERDQVGDVTLSPHAHLEHEVAGLLIRRQDGERETHLGVEGATSGDRRTISGEDAGDEVLGARLAAGAGDRHDSACQTVTPVPRCQQSEGLHWVRDDDARQVLTIGIGHRSCTEDQDGSGGHGSGSEVMTVDALAHDRHEQGSRND